MINKVILFPTTLINYVRKKYVTKIKIFYGKIITADFIFQIIVSLYHKHKYVNAWKESTQKQHLCVSVARILTEIVITLYVFWLQKALSYKYQRH